MAKIRTQIVKGEAQTFECDYLRRTESAWGVGESQPSQSIHISSYFILASRANAIKNALWTWGQDQKVTLTKKEMDLEDFIVFSKGNQERMKQMWIIRDSDEIAQQIGNYGTEGIGCLLAGDSSWGDDTLPSVLMWEVLCSFSAFLD